MPLKKDLEDKDIVGHLHCVLAWQYGDYWIMFGIWVNQIGSYGLATS